jgi:hypothetical protein
MTRKERKGYLRSDFRRDPGADSADPLELVSAAKGTERVAVGDNARGEPGTHSAEGLDLCSGGDVEVDDRGDDWLGRGARLDEMNSAAPALPLLFRPAAMTGGVHGLDLRIERAPGRRVDGCLAMKDRGAARSRAKDDNCAEEQERLSLARGWHESLYSRRDLGTASSVRASHPFFTAENAKNAE